MDADEANRRPPYEQRTASERLQRASTFGTEVDLSASATRSSSFPVLTADERGLYVVPPEEDLSGMTNSRYQLWGNLDQPISPDGDFLDEISSGSEIEEVIEEDSETESNALSINFDASVDGAESSSKVRLAKDRLQAKLLNIIKSRFTDYGNDEGEVAIALNCGQESKSDDNFNLFRWVHLHDDVVDFEGFVEKSLKISPLSSSNRRLVKEHLRSAQMKYEKPIWTQDATEGRRFEPFVFQELSLQDTPESSHLNKKVTIVCFPFFHLDEPTKEVDLMSGTNHPPLTLLQVISPSTALQRDMQQVVCSSPLGQKSRCFHVSQLWGLIINDTHLFTCSRLPLHKISREAVTLISEPTTGPPYIKVTDGGNCTWQLALKDCETWFGFTAHFMEIGINQLEVARSFDDLYDVTLSGRSIKCENWEEIIANAKESAVHLILTRRTHAERFQVMHGAKADNSPETDDASETTDGSALGRPYPWQSDELPPSPVPQIQTFHVEHATDEDTQRPSNEAGLPSIPPPVTRDFGSSPLDTEPEGSAAATKAGTTKADKEPGVTEPSPIEHPEFHALSWYSIPRRSSESVNATEKASEQSEQDLPALLNRINKRLLQHGTKRDKKAYLTSEMKALPDVAMHLLAVTRDINQSGGYISSLSNLDTFFVAAVQVFELFLDLKNESEVARKYWGSVLFILKAVLVDPGAATLFSRSIDIFKRIAYLANIIRGEMSQPHGPRPGSFALPQDFGRAWLHCIHFLTLFRSRNATDLTREQHAEKCEALLHHGRQLLWRTWTKVPLQKKEVAPPLALFSVLINQVQKDISTYEVPPNIAHVYREHWKQLVIDVNSGRLKRSMSKFDPLQHEITAILTTLEQQQDVLTRFCRAIEEQSTGWSSFHSRHLRNAPRPEVPMIQDCITHVVDRIQLFRTIFQDSQKLEKWTDEHLTAFTRERHDNAIYVFTIFTVIFLPLSFVCSFLGMNTADVRNMSGSQTIFWAAALPLTLVVVLIALLVTDELGEAWMTFRDKLGLPARRLGITPRREPSSYWRRTSGAQDMLKNISERKRSAKARDALAAAATELPKREPKTEDIKMLNERAATFESIAR